MLWLDATKIPVSVVWRAVWSGVKMRLRSGAAALGLFAAAAGAGGVAASLCYVAGAIQIIPMAPELFKTTGFMQGHDLRTLSESGNEFDSIGC